MSPPPFDVWRDPIQLMVRLAGKIQKIYKMQRVASLKGKKGQLLLSPIEEASFTRPTRDR